jgi:flagellin
VPQDVSAKVEGYVHVSQNSLSFQVGPTRGQQVRISLIDAKTDRLATGVKNESGFRSLREINVTTSQGAQDALALVDDAITSISSVRANLGAFQKNTLQSNTNSLRIAHENLTSAESSLRDADMAEEMSHFTRNQIMLQSGVAMLAQANQTPQSVLQLLNNRNG